MTGLTFSLPLVNFYLSGCEEQASPEEAEEALLFLDETQFQTLEAAVDRIIPETETPGALAAKVPRYIDKVLNNVFEAEDAARFKAGLVEMEGYAKDVFNISFADLPKGEMDTYLGSLQKATLGSEEDPKAPGFFRMLQNITLFGFFTSEIGVTKVLEYLPVPGEYKGCVPLSEYPTTWAL